MVRAATSGRSGAFWLRWSWRDLRSRWVAVLAIAMVLAIGIGVYAGLGSTATWRRESNDASFSALSMHDLRVSLSPGTFTAESTLLDATSAIESAASVDAVAERLVTDSQVDTGGPDSVLVPARLVGMTFRPERPVDEVWIRDGTEPRPGEAVLEAKFADDRRLDATGVVTVASGRPVDYTGLGVAPEDFFYEGPEGTIFGEGELAILYVSLATAQDLTGRPDAVNDLVLTLVPGAEREVVQAQLASELADLGLSATISTREDADAVRVLYEDIDNDQRFWNALSGLVLGAAALAAFNLVTRIVEAQRRELGIGMALGVPRRQLAIRPLLVGLQVSVIGTIAGLGMGFLIGNAFADLLESFLPLPIHRTPFQFGVFAQAAALGLVVPLAASAVPVWRALRVEPIEAIRTGHLTAKTSRLTDWTGRFSLPGSTMNQMPVRNVLRNPRRAVLTAVGVGAAITALVGVLGMLDSFDRTLDRGADEFTKGDPDRVVVQLDTFYPADSPVVAAIGGAPAVGHLDAGLRLPVTASAVGADDGDDDIELLVELVDFDRAAWTPTLVGRAEAIGDNGIVIARKAADDLDVEVGDVVNLRHPVRVGGEQFVLSDTDHVVVGIHANPIRTFAFLDLAAADQFGLRGAVNVVQAYPADGEYRRRRPASDLRARGSGVEPADCPGHPGHRRGARPVLELLRRHGDGGSRARAADLVQRHPDHGRGTATRTRHHAGFRAAGSHGSGRRREGERSRRGGGHCGRPRGRCRLRPVDAGVAGQHHLARCGDRSLRVAENHRHRDDRRDRCGSHGAAPARRPTPEDEPARHAAGDGVTGGVSLDRSRSDASTSDRVVSPSSCTS